MNPYSELDSLPEMLTVAEVAAYLRMGKTAAYEMLRQGRLPSIRMGCKILVPREGLREALVTCSTCAAHATTPEGEGR